MSSFTKRGRWFVLAAICGTLTCTDSHSPVEVELVPPPSYDGIEPGGLVSHWRFDEGSGPTAADDVGMNLGTLVNGPTWSTGRVGGALTFDGSNDFVQVSDDPSLDITSELTIAAWISPHSAGQGDQGRIVDKAGADGTVGWVFHVNSSNRLGFQQHGKTPGINTRSNVISIDTWQHVVAVVSGGRNVTFYVNGTNVGSGTLNGAIAANTKPLWIGIRGDGQRAFDGSIDEVRIYDRALSAGEVDALYQAEAFGPPPAPTVTFDADPLSITLGGSSTLTWSSTNATTCTASDGWTGDKGTSGTEVVSPTTSTTYTLTCDGPGGSTVESVTISVAGMVYVVNAVDDETDGVCDATHCSLREAIAAANASAGEDLIQFSIAGGAGFDMIQPTSALPAITESVMIDGTTDPDAVVLNGLNAGSGVDGLRVTGGSATIRGLVILNFAGGAGIRLGTGGNVVVGNIIGAEYTGTSAFPNQTGIIVEAGTSNTIGGSQAADRNLISGNSGDGILLTGTSSGTTIVGNYIGVRVNGAALLGNGGQGVLVNSTADNHIGGAGSGETNVIGGSGGDGVRITGAGATGNHVIGNVIGTDAALTGVRLANTLSGVHVTGGASGTEIGGSASGAGNILAASVEHGVRLDGSSTGTLVRGNTIGTVDGVTHVGNVKQGVYIASSSGNTIGGTGAGDGNLIVFDGLDGVAVVSGGGNAILGNSIYQNQTVSNPEIPALGIDLGDDDVTPNDAGDGDSGPNGLQNYPTLTSAATSGSIAGTLNSLASTQFRVEFFVNGSVDGAGLVCDRSGFGEGETFLGAQNVMTDAGGNASYAASFGVLTAGQQVTATATAPNGNTSEFSACVTVEGPAALADVEVTKSGPSSVGPGADVTYTLTLTNHGAADAAGVVLEDVLPGAATFVSASNGGTEAGGTVTWPAMSLTNGQSVQRTVTVTAPASGTLLNVARATASTTDPDPTNNDGTAPSAQVSTTVQEPPVSGLVSHWRFDEGSGPLAMDAADGNAGMLVNGPTWTTGQLGGALRFDGSNDYVQVADAANLDITSELTIAAWINPQSMGQGDQGRILDKAGADGTVGWVFRLNSSNRLGFQQHGKTPGVNTVSNVISTDTWQHVAAVVSGGRNVTFYVNGTNVGSGTLNGAIAANAKPLSIGIRGDGQRAFDGSMDEVRVYNRALSSGEIHDLYQSEMSGSPPPPTVSLMADPTSIVVGGSSTLTWNATNATACTASDGWTGDKGTSGTEVVTPTTSTTYTLTCDGAGGSTSVSAVVSVIPLGSTSFHVNTTSDTDDGSCDLIDCSLREAIVAANGHAGADVIQFSIGGSGLHVIGLGSALPAITEAVTIDGTTDPNGVVLNGVSAGASADGLRVTGGPTTIRGLVILNFSGSGIRLSTGGNVVVGNVVGADITGTTAYGNGTGIRVEAGSSNEIGGSGPGDRNVVSGNTGDGVLLTGTSSGTLVRGNYVGVKASGNATLGNGGSGVHVSGSANNRVGGTGSGEGNVAGGNGADGVLIDGGATGNHVEGNLIGADAAKSGIRVGNTLSGVHVTGGASGNEIGGGASGAGNVIAANAEDGVRLDGGASGNGVRGNTIGSMDGVSHAGDVNQGVYIAASGNTVGGTGAGEGNLIIFNGRDGVAVVSGSGNSILGNSIYQNQAVANPQITALGIDLGDDDVTANDAGDGDSGPNGLQNYPTLTSATTSGSIVGTLNSLSGTQFRLEFFVDSSMDPQGFVCDPSGFGEGETFLGALDDVMTDGSGNASFTTDFGTLTVGQRVTATATAPNGSTSEFSACVQVTGTPTGADVEVAKSGPGSVAAGADLTYTLTATNHGPEDATDVVLADDLPSAVTFVSASDGGTESGGTVTWPAVMLTNGQSVQRTVTVTAPASGVLLNVAHATSTSSDPNPGNNNGSNGGARVSTTVQGSAPDGLVSHWQFDEGSGSMAADGVSGNTGTLVNGPTWITGQVGGALDFDGFNDHVQVPDAASLDITSELTIAAWINPGSMGQGDQGRIVDKAGADGTVGWVFRLNSSNRLSFQQHGKTPGITTRSNVIQTNTWQHVAAVVTGGTSVTFYVNGTNVGEATLTGAIAANTKPLSIGIRGDGQRAFDGSIDELRIYDRALTAGEIAGLAQEAGGLATAELKLGERVQTLPRATIYTEPSGAALSAQPAGLRGTLLEGPVESDGDFWWRVAYESGENAWSTESDLESLPYPAPESQGGWRSLVVAGYSPTQARKDAILERTGIDWDQLDAAHDYSETNAPSSLLVIRHGWVAGEWGPTSPQRVASVTKSLTSLAVGKLMDLSDAGQLAQSIGFDSQASAFLPPEFRESDPLKEGIRIEHLLTMSAGMLPADPDTLTEEQRLTLPMDAEPGTVWAYSSVPPNLLSVIVESVAGESLGDFFNHRIAAPIGASPLEWRTLDDGTTEGSAGVTTSARDLARIAYLTLQGGEWNDGSGPTRVLDEGRMATLTSPARLLASTTFAQSPGSPFRAPEDAPSYYGYLWWTNSTQEALGPSVPTDAYYMHGCLDDLAVVVPSEHLVVVRLAESGSTCTDPDFRTELMERVMAAIAA